MDINTKTVGIKGVAGRDVPRLRVHGEGVYFNAMISKKLRLEDGQDRLAFNVEGNRAYMRYDRHGFVVRPKTRSRTAVINTKALLPAFRAATGDTGAAEFLYTLGEFEAEKGWKLDRVEI